jgi:hypothetical protein
MRGNITRQEGADQLKGRTHLDKATSKFLQSLAGSASSMSNNQRSQVARALQKAANSMPDDPVRSDLQQAASALGHDDLKTARQALRHAAARFDNSNNQRGTRTKVNNAGSALNSVKNDVNGLHRKPANQSNNGQAPPPGAPRSSMQGGKEQGNTSPGNGVGGNQGKHGAGAQLRGPQGEDRASAGGGRNRASSGGADRYSVVYIPGLIVKGGHPLPYDIYSAPKRVPAVPYQQVIAQYQRTARASLDRSPLPPSMQEYVRQYFTALSHQ